MSARLVSTNDDARVLAVVRAGVFGIWFLKVLATPVALYADLPLELFTRFGVLSALPQEWWYALASSPAALLILKGLLLLLCLAAALGAPGYHLHAVGAAVLLLVFDGVMKGFNGFINHAQAGLLLSAGLLALYPAADAWALRKQSGPARPEGYYAGPLLSLAIIVTLLYSFVGIRRVMTGGIALYTGDAIPTYFAVNALAPAITSFELGLWLARSAPLVLLAKAGFLMITAAEVLAPLCIVSRLFRLAWLAIMVPFHLSTMLLMNILFWENMVLLLLVLSPLPALIVKARSEPASLARWRRRPQPAA